MAGVSSLREIWEGDMKLTLSMGIACVLAPAFAHAADFRMVTDAMLRNPDASDWLMLSRTYDEQRYSPLDQINKSNVATLDMVWARGLPEGTQETTPIVHDGVIYTVEPGGGVLALDGRTGDEKWEYRPKFPADMAEFIGDGEHSRVKSIAIYQDMVYYPSPDGLLVALDAQTGKVRWKVQTQDYHQQTENTGGMIVADGKVITSRTCVVRAGCFIGANDAMTGQEVWRFYETAAPGEPGGDTWGGMPADQRVASSWGLPGSFDPARKTLYWGISNPKPYTRLKRHNGNADAVPRTAPAELYSDSTVALDVETGKLKWYYQHLPGDDWDADYHHERLLIHTRLDPDPAALKWINPLVSKGSARDIVFMTGEAGGMWALDRDTGQFLWATPFPFDVPTYNVSDIDVTTGRTHINWDSAFKKEGERHTVCFQNDKSYWAIAYDPKNNSIYIPYNDACLDMTADSSKPLGFSARRTIARPGSDPNKFFTIAKVNVSTGKIDRIYSQPVAGNGSALVTAGDLLFWGDVDRRFRAFDPDTGKILWQTILGGIVQTSTITYAIAGKQYLLVMTGDGQSGTRNPVALSHVSTVRGANGIYVFALPEK
jgi:alcohol dehydrogenase (cytochrome c)